ncbi:inositol monophosphatase family protein [Roseibacterium sp. SDUM158017]|uniref:inositol monophosphatase family protein n=1 Tax=Roseicyclus salinarum TaxID=3036773 RepID=UPI0024152FEC|nr:inositol monophosphatase family protein [Roseibacterium sp. SDUM158017]MDG4648692.1 inositol monophosphatase family protein [Roseibacterium sp. SDUM158017]
MGEDDLALAERLAAEAGALLLDRWQARGRLAVTTKRAGDFVSEADRAAEDLLRAGIAEARPGDGWLGEETGAADGNGRRWIVDPLDGTTNFLRGIGHWAVSVALEEGGALTLGVVHDPVRGETFAARRGQGATLNGRQVAVADTKDMSAALFGTGIPFGGMAHIDDHADDLARLMPACAGVRRMGAAALDLAYVATGRLDGFWERRLQPWDIAAGLVLLREAGAVVEGWATGEPAEARGNVITATPALFPAFAAILRA